MDLNAETILVALRALGEELGADSLTTSVGPPPDSPTWRLTLAGGTAGLLAGAFRASRTTTDCDVPWIERDASAPSRWTIIEAAASRVADRLGLSPQWLNRKCAAFAWSWPVGWESRCERVEGDFGPLDVRRLARVDLIAAKVMSAPKRPQDRLDLRDLAPTRDELDLAEANLERLRHEDLGRREFEAQQVVIDDLRESL